MNKKKKEIEKYDTKMNENTGRLQIEEFGLEESEKLESEKLESKESKVFEEEVFEEEVQENLGKIDSSNTAQASSENILNDQLLEEIRIKMQEDDFEPVADNISKKVDEQKESLQETKSETKAGPFKFSKKIAVAAAIVAAVFLAVYIGVAMHYSERFLPGTSMNGEDCSGKTVNELEKELQERVEEYELVLQERNDVTEIIKGTDIGIQYNNTGAVKEAMKQQNSFAWIISMFQKKNIIANVDFVYDEAKLTEVITNLECLKEENQILPVSAIPVYADGKFVIQEETYGSKIKTEELEKAVIESVNTMQTVLNLEEVQCYEAPKFLKDSEEVVAANDMLNKYLSAKITYSLDSITVTLDATQISGWLSVDENMEIILSESGVKAFADTLGDTYNTKPRAQQITTPTGKVATVSGATKGRIIGTAAECEQLIKEIKEGKVITREPIIAQQATPAGQYAWGKTYVEVDLSAQHMWYIQNGSVVFESDVVTGSPGRDTPAGVFEILTKKRNKTLVGNIVPETGKPEYETPVDYWARVTWSGIGFHDATWQPDFGGQLYKEGYGSHGCINMPLEAVAQFYGMISVGDPVVIHY